MPRALVFLARRGGSSGSVDVWSIHSAPFGSAFLHQRQRRWQQQQISEDVDALPRECGRCGAAGSGGGWRRRRRPAAASSMDQFGLQRSIFFHRSTNMLRRGESRQQNIDSHSQLRRAFCPARAVAQQWLRMVFEHIVNSQPVAACE